MVHTKKDKYDVSDLILQAAKKLFVENGVAQTTIRSIATAIGYSVGTVYVYFKDKDAILHALHIQGFTQLGAQFAVLTKVTEPMERLKAMGRIYIDFALQNPDMYDLMFNLKAPISFVHDTANKDWKEGASTFNALKSCVTDCVKAGYFKGGEVDALSFMIWSTVHGMCSLQISERSGSVQLKNASTILKRAFDAFTHIIDP
ncbi:TetR/AcrR family transcriptional regulator [Ferruginibacter yonginensis]|uniref:TetR/AcrR family transcriptional regulator n=1 Tax=Ferruginibacter yonginensis TaxID=1310416 RepID=A0ABV8QM63_9BACT